MPSSSLPQAWIGASSSTACSPGSGPGIFLAFEVGGGWEYPGGIIQVGLSSLPCCSCWRKGSQTLPSLCFMNLLFRFFSQFRVFFAFRLFCACNWFDKKKPNPHAGGSLRPGCVDGGRTVQFCKELLSFSMEIKTSSLSSQLERAPVKGWSIAGWDLGGCGCCQLGVGIRDPLSFYPKDKQPLEPCSALVLFFQLSQRHPTPSR